MSATLRAKLVQEIKNNVDGRISGGYFTYGEYKLHKARWEGELAQAHVAQIEASPDLTPFDSGSGRIGGSIYGSWTALGEKLLTHLRKNPGKKTYTLISGTKITADTFEIHYKRNPNNQKAVNGAHIENAIDAAIKEFMKKELRDIAMEYVHGRTGTGQFDNALFRGNKEEVRADIRNRRGSQVGGQGINVDQGIAKAIDEVVLNKANYHIFSTVLDYYNHVFGYDHEVKDFSTGNTFKQKLVMRGSLDTKEAADNANTYDRAIKEEAIAFLEDANGEMAIEIMKRLKKANPNDWKGIGPAKMQTLWADSPGPIEKLDKLGKAKVIENFLKAVKTKPDLRLKINKKILQEAKKKTKGTKVKHKGKKAFRSNTKQAGAARAAISKVQQKAGKNPLALRNMLNEMLPVAVAQNMQSPALNYRTGRFANSVRVTNVTQGPRGGNTMIDATYMTNPYETFAPGGDKYTPQRNPERLIRRTLREVATGIIGNKFGVNIR